MNWSEIEHDQFGNAYVTLNDANAKVDDLTCQLAALSKTVDVWTMDPVSIIGICSAALLLIFLFSTFFIVQQQTSEIIERFGKFHRVAKPGLRFRIPLIEQRVWEADLRIESLAIEVETKTKDNVFVTIKSAVQFAVVPEHVYESYYQLSDDEEQLRSYVFDVIRGRVPKLMLDEAYEQKDDIALAVKGELTEAMTSFGYRIHQVLVTDIEPDARVKAAMNDINAAQRERDAATARGDAEKILVVKKAEAERDRAVLQGEGLAGQRKAIIDGLKGSVEEFRKAVPGSTGQQVMQVVMMAQYFDMVRDLSASGDSRVIMVPHTPGGMGQIAEQIRQALLPIQSEGVT